MSRQSTFSLAKLTAVIVASAVVAGSLFTVAAQRAHAVTLAELVELFIALDIISEDKADEARAVLENQEDTSGGSTGSGDFVCNTTFTRDLSTGDTGADVMALQQFLNSVDGITVAASGAGSPGMETSYYGGLTAAAVSDFQEMYAGDILTPLGLTAGTGYLGASTRAKANELCTTGGGAGAGDDGDMPDTPDLPDLPDLGGDDEDGMDEDEDMMDDDEELGGGEASLEDFDSLSDPSDEDIQEGSEDEAVFGFEFDVEDADVSVRRVDVRFEMTGASSEDEPWNVFDTVQLWRDGEMIAEENADDEDDWSDEGGDVYEIRFSGLDEDFEEGDTAEFLVGVSVASNIDDSDIQNDDMEWTIWIPDEGVRARDGAGLDQYVGDDDTSPNDSTTLVIESAAEGVELSISESSSNPDAATIKVDDDDDTDDVTVLVADVEAEESEVEVNEVVVYATTTDSLVNMGQVVSDVTLVVEGVGEFDWDYFDTATNTTNDDLSASAGGYFTFDLEGNDDEFTIDADEELEFSIEVDLQDNSAYVGQTPTIEFSFNSDARSGWSADDVEGDEIGQSGSDDITGTALGEEHTLVETGIFAEVVSTDSDDTVIDNDDDRGTFDIVVDVTAFEEDAYIEALATSSDGNPGTGVSGFIYSIVDSQGNVMEFSNATSMSATLSSGADEEGSAAPEDFRVAEGDTERFTMTVNYTPGEGDENESYRVLLEAIHFTSEADGATATPYTPTPDEDFRTDFELIGA
ncbi:hypothetical protein GVX82_01195 [Patescibacteria group bacterium]|jgi:hypothetical protein|nr:hypothetical protein [Patescibacteria group bacterium]